MYSVYILRSLKWSRYYVGYTSDIDKRLEKHNSGGVKSTKHGCPWELTWIMQVSKNRIDAIRLEKKIKNRGARRYLEDIAF